MDDDLRLCGVWTRIRRYKPGDLVALNFKDWICVKEHQGEKPPSLEYWEEYKSCHILKK